MASQSPSRKTDGRMIKKPPRGGHDQWDDNRQGLLKLLEEVRRAVHWAPGSQFPPQWSEHDCPPPVNIDTAFISVVPQGHMGWGVCFSPIVSSIFYFFKSH